MYNIIFIPNIESTLLSLLKPPSAAPTCTASIHLQSLRRCPSPRTRRANRRPLHTPKGVCRGERCTERISSVPRRTAPGLRARPDTLHPVVGGPGGGAAEVTGDFSLRLRGRHRNPLLRRHHHGGKGPRTACCGRDGELGPKMEDEAGRQQDSSSGAVPTLPGRP